MEIAYARGVPNSPFGNLAVQLDRPRGSLQLLACAALHAGKRRLSERMGQ